MLYFLNICIHTYIHSRLSNRFKIFNDFKISRITLKQLHFPIIFFSFFFFLHYSTILFSSLIYYKRKCTYAGTCIYIASCCFNLQAIKKLSTKSRKAKKSRNLSSWHSTIPEYETESLSWSLLSLDTKSIDTFTTYVADNSEDSVSMCCYCDEYEENQRNENIENEMMI